MSEKLRIKLQKLKAITIVWMLIAIVFALMEHFTLVSSYSLGTQNEYSFQSNLTFHLVSSVMAVIFGASFLVFYIHEKFRERPYWQGIAAIVLTYIAVVTIITFVMGFVLVPSQAGLSFGESGFDAAYRAYLLDTVHLKNILAWSIVVGFTQLLLQMSDKFGHGLMWDSIKGKYHKAQEEERIFMFLDLKSSTATAEKLGNRLYHEFLKDYFSDITNAILYNKGEVYQYVGDEVVVTWKMNAGLEQQHCLKCYFDIRWSIDKKKEKYLQKYGMIPEFKAGLHSGKVVAGEIGIIKRDITYSGDVLNTAARIQAKCNEFEVPILVSKSLLDLFQGKIPFITTEMGDIALRGKASRVALSTLGALPQDSKGF